MSPLIEEPLASTGNASEPTQKYRALWIKIDRQNPVLADNKIARRGQEVVWSAVQKEAFTVEFKDDSPVQPPTFTILSGEHVTTTIVADAILDKHYKYSIQDENGNTLVDPEIVIRQ